MPPLLDLLAVDDTTENGADRSCCQQIIRGWKEPQQAEEGGEEYQIPVTFHFLI
jgi:hypothetical protein